MGQSDSVLHGDSARGWRREEGRTPGEHSLSAQLPLIFQTQLRTSLSGQSWPSPSRPQTYYYLFHPPSVPSYQMQIAGSLNNYFII